MLAESVILLGFGGLVEMSVVPLGEGGGGGEGHAGNNILRSLWSFVRQMALSAGEV